MVGNLVQVLLQISWIIQQWQWKNFENRPAYCQSNERSWSGRICRLAVTHKCLRFSVSARNEARMCRRRLWRLHRNGVTLRQFRWKTQVSLKLSELLSSFAFICIPSLSPITHGSSSSSSSPSSRSPLASSLTRLVFHSELKTWLFGKSFPP